MQRGLHEELAMKNFKEWLQILMTFAILILVGIVAFAYQRDMIKQVVREVMAEVFKNGM